MAKVTDKPEKPIPDSWRPPSIVIIDDEPKPRRKATRKAPKGKAPKGR